MKLLLLLLLPALLGGVTVVDESGAPLRGVAISDGARVVFTDSTGTATLLGEPTALVFTRLGYHPCEILVASLPEPVVLRRRPEPVPGFRVTARTPSRVIEVPSGQPGSVAVLLRRHPDIFAGESALPGHPQVMSLQGGLARHVQIELDGVVLNRAGQAFDLASIPAAAIERIEVVTGPVPGSGGMDGVVRLWSRRVGQHNLWRVGATTGAFGLRRLQHELELGDETLSFAMLGRREVATGDFSYDDPLTGEPSHRHNSDSRADDVRLRLDMHSMFTVRSMFTTHTAIPLGCELQRRVFERGLPGPAHQQSLHDAARLSGDVSRLRLELGGRSLQLRLLREDERIHYRNIGSTNPAFRSSGITRSELRQGSIESSRAWGRWRGEVGLDLRRETFAYDDRLNPTGSIDRRNLDNLGLQSMIERQGGCGRLIWSAAGTLRGDWIDNDLRESPEASGRFDMALDWNASLPVRFELGLGRSFTLPSFYDLYWRGDSQAMGNPDLRPESSYGGQARFELAAAAWKLSAGGSWRWYDDLIYWHRAEMGWKPDNIDGAEKRVVELAASLRPVHFLELTADWRRIFAWDRSLDADDTHGDHWGCNLTHTPSSQTRLAAALTPGLWRLEADWTRTGRRWPTRDNLWGSLAPYELLHATVSWSPRWGGLAWHLAAEGENLLDRRYEVFSSEPMPGRHWQISLSAECRL
ncbi:MAG: TonB-dependent receptor [Candidatus Cloacimonetes bacterium]|nr:TonB-dependent receptor [Candidatus Cloacimonadota bacterium]